MRGRHSGDIPVLFCRGAALNVLEILNRMGGRVVEGTGLEKRTRMSFQHFPNQFRRFVPWVSKRLRGWSRKS